MANKKSTKPAITSFTKDTRVKRRNTFAVAHSKRGGAGSGFHGDKSKFNRKIKHRANQFNY